jgi:hypothetical protein
MKDKPNKRTNLDLLFYFVEYTGGDFGKLRLEQFKQELLPHLKLSLWAFEELSEEEFQQKAAQLSRHRRAWTPASPTPTVRPSEARGAVPDTAMT